MRVESNARWNNAVVFAFTFISGLIIYHFSFGIETLDPTNVDWLLVARHDWGTHYLGWAFYRTEPWTFPLGAIHNYYYPVGTNVGFTDSIPLAAILLKPFSGILPDQFQYFGIWMVACMIASGIYAILICRRLGAGNLQLIIVGIFIIANPVLIFRGLHHALCAHWIVLAGIYCYVSSEDQASSKSLLKHQLIILMLSAAINPYLCFMSLAFTFFISLKLFVQGRILRNAFIYYNLASFFFVLVIWYIIGLVSFNTGENLAVNDAYGLYSLNLNCLYNPSGFSKFLPIQPWVSWHQYEGYMYPGFGMIILFFLSLMGVILFTRFGKMSTIAWFKQHKKSLVVGIIFCAVVTMFSVTNVVSLDDKILFTVPIPGFISKLGDIFRASARFFWIPYYFLLIGILTLFIKLKINSIIKTSILIVCVSLQFFDIWPLIRSKQAFRQPYVPPIDYAGWRSVVHGFDKIVTYPPFEDSYASRGDYQDFGNVAAMEHKPITLGYVARGNEKAMRNFVDSLAYSISENKIDEKTVFITNESHISDFGMLIQTGSVNIFSKDNIYYLYSSKIDRPIGSTSDLAKVDSVKRFFSYHLYGQRIMDSIPLSNKIAYGFSRFNDGEEFITMSGWAFDSEKETNKNDSLFMLLKSTSDSYLWTTDKVSQTDLTTHLRRSDVSGSGFSLAIKKSALAKGIYKVLVVLKKSDGQLISYQTNRTIAVNLPRQDVRKLSAMSFTGFIDLAPSVDVFDVGKTDFKISGWAALKGTDATGAEISLVFKSGNDYYFIPTDSEFRNDVTAYFSNSHNFDVSGYRIRIAKNLLPQGDYTFGLYIHNSITGKQGLTMLDRMVTFE